MIARNMSKSRFAGGELPVAGDTYALMNGSTAIGTVLTTELRSGHVNWSQYRLVSRLYYDTILQSNETCELCGGGLLMGTRARGRGEKVTGILASTSRFVAACAPGACGTLGGSVPASEVYLNNVLESDAACELCGRALKRGSVARTRVLETVGNTRFIGAACAVGACGPRSGCVVAPPGTASQAQEPAPIIGWDRHERPVRTGMTIRATDRVGMTCRVQEVRFGTHFHGPHIERGEGYFADIPFDCAEVVEPTWLAEECRACERHRHIPLTESGRCDECSRLAADALQSALRWLAESTELQSRERRYQWFRAAVSVAVAEEPAFRCETDCNDVTMTAWLYGPLDQTEAYATAYGDDLDYFGHARWWVRCLRRQVERAAGRRVLGAARTKRT